MPPTALVHRKRLINAILFLMLSAGGSLADIYSKNAVFAWRGLPGQRDVWWMVDGYFGIETAVNVGALFGMGAGQGTLFAGLSMIAAVGILVWMFRFGGVKSRWLSVALGLVGGGIVGNLYDRLGLWCEPNYPVEWSSAVRDWILFRVEGVPLLDPWPNFNIADSLLVTGAIMLMVHSMFWAEPAETKPDETKPHDSKPAETKPDEVKGAPES